MSDRKTLYRTWISQAGQKLYESLDQGERHVVQFGMFPREKMEQAQAKLLQEFVRDEGRPPISEECCNIARDLAVAVMDAANRGPDKLVV